MEQEVLTLLEDLSPHLWQDMCHWWSRKCLPFWKIYHHISNRIGATDGAGSTYPYGWLITTFVTRVTGQVPLVAQEVLTLLEDLSPHLWQQWCHWWSRKWLPFWKTYHHICDWICVTDGAGSVYPFGKLITTFLTGQVSLMEQEVLILLEDLSLHL